MSQAYSDKEMLAALVGFDTESQNSNLPLIAFVEDYLAEHGIASERVPDATGEKASLFAQIGPAVPGGVVLSGHTDVVPVEGQDWSSDPYRLDERNGRLYGRGTADMKGFLAICLAAVPRMQAAGLKRPVQLALSYDEEIGCLGAPDLIAAMRSHLPAASAAVIGEPTTMQVVTGHKAIVEMHVAIRGHEVHSSLMHEGVSAVMTGAELIAWLWAQSEENRARAKPGLYVPNWTTLHSGVVHGGTAHNITARDCSFQCEIRAIPEESADDWAALFVQQAARLEARNRAVNPETWIEVDIRSSVPGCHAETDGAAEALARRLTGDNGVHVVAYGTEAGQFQDAGYSAVVCGPGSIEQAHQADEWISLDQLASGRRFIDRLIAELASG